MSQLAVTATETDAQVRGVVYDGFITHSVAPSKAEVAKSIGMTEENVAASFRRLAEAHMLVLQPASGEVLMANPFSAVPTAFKVEVGNQQWWANCIWDALGILAMIDRDGQVKTSCPDCGEVLPLTVDTGRIADRQAVVHFSVPAAHWWDDIVFT